VLDPRRIVDPPLRSGYAIGVEFKLQNFSDKCDLNHFHFVFPICAVEVMGAAMLSKGGDDGWCSWAVTHGEVWRIIRYDMAIMLLYS
jgi:hypothetical protein